VLIHGTFHMSRMINHFLWVGTLHEWMRMQMLAKPSSNLLQRTGGDHRRGSAQLGWRTFMMTCLRWILGYMRLEIWCKIGLSRDGCLCTALCTRSGACNYWIVCQIETHKNPKILKQCCAINDNKLEKTSKNLHALIRLDFCCLCHTCTKYKQSYHFLYI